MPTESGPETARDAQRLVESALKFLQPLTSANAELQAAVDLIESASNALSLAASEAASETARRLATTAVDELRSALAHLERAQLTEPEAQGAIAQIARALYLLAPRSPSQRVRRGVVIDDLVSEPGPTDDPRNQRRS